MPTILPSASSQGISLSLSPCIFLSTNMWVYPIPARSTHNNVGPMSTPRFITIALFLLRPSTVGPIQAQARPSSTLAGWLALSDGMHQTYTQNPADPSRRRRRFYCFAKTACLLTLSFTRTNLHIINKTFAFNGLDLDILFRNRRQNKNCDIERERYTQSVYFMLKYENTIYV